MDGKEDMRDQSPRPDRKMTEKGLLYKLEQRQKDRCGRIRDLNALGERLSQLMKVETSQATVKGEYFVWLRQYEDLLLLHADCQKLLAEEDRGEDNEKFAKADRGFRLLKNSVEQWVLSTGRHICSTSVVSGASSKASSHLSAARMNERARKAELLARAAALTEKQVIEAERLQLKQKEEQLNLRTEMKVSDAKARVFDELEQSELRDQELERSLADNPHKVLTWVNQLPDIKPEVGGMAATGGAPVDHSSQQPETKKATLGPPVDPCSRQKPDVKPKVSRMPVTVGPPVAHSTPRVQNIKPEVGSIPTTGDQLVRGVSHRLQNAAVPGFDMAEPGDGGLLAVARELNKPKADIEKFGGNPMNYNRFLRQFNSRVTANTDSYEELLNFLMQFTTGEAHRIVSGYSHLNAERGYVAALEEMEERYGDVDVVAQAYVKRAMDWPVVKQGSARALDDYSIFLRECQFAVESVEAARVLEYSENLKLLVRKLPFYMHDKWRSIVYDIKERKQVVKFHNFVSFVRKEAKKAMDPVYGKDVMGATNTQDKQPAKSSSSTGSRKNFAVDVTESTREQAPSVKPESGSAKSNARLAFTKPCLFCQGSSHSLDICRNITKENLKDRYTFIQKSGLCFACLKGGHSKRDCRGKSICTICGKEHPSILHVDSRRGPVLDSSSYGKPNVTTGAMSTGAGQALPIVPVRIKSRSSDKYVETYAFLDSGSTATFVSEEVVRALAVEGRQTKINLLTMGQEQVQNTCVVSGLEVSSLDGRHLLELPPVLTQPRLPVGERDVISFEQVRRWPHLRNIPLERIESDVGILIGVNVPQAMEPWDVVPSVGNSPFAVKTVLGWVVNGPLGVESSMSVKVNHISLEEQIQNQFNHDFSERTIDVLEHSREDKQFLDMVSRSMSFENGHYVIGLPFKSEDVRMPNNRKQAEQRLASLSKRLNRDEGFSHEYGQFMNKVIGEGYAQRVPPELLKRDDGRVWYLPHHGVYHPRKNKLRVVFDCAARYRGTSLNDQLLQGPNLTNSLLGTLLRFRQEEIVIMGDIDSMFYQVHVPPRDCSFLRFLWWEDGDLGKPVAEYQMVVHLFGAKSSPSCANFALRETALSCDGQFDIDVVNTVLKNFYVDDCLKSTPTVSSAITMMTDLQAVLHGGGFHIAKWVSNSREVMNAIPVADRAKGIKNLDLDQDTLPIERALGVQWCVETDVFRFQIGVKEQSFSRRGILSMVSSVYDPLGFLAPFMLKAKRILQELCKLQLGWDEKVPEKFWKQWCLWLEDLQKLADFKVDRCVKPPGFGMVQSTQLHHFADASESGYGTVSYLRLENAEGEIHSSFIMGKSRVAPLKQTTIPRSELTAATVAVRTDRMLKDELDMSIDRTVFWTDSMTVLRYIRNTTSRFRTFVSNRLAIIHDGSEPSDWRYVNTKSNPADIASRGISADGLLQGGRWISGPEFLRKTEDMWPDVPLEISDSPNPCDPEVKLVALGTVVSSLPVVESSVEAINKLIERYSSWFALKRSVCWILKIRKVLLQRVRHKNGSREESILCDSGRISVQDMNDAENAILMYVQRQAFADELDTLSKRRLQVKSSSSIRKLDPVLDCGLLRVGGRLSEACMPMESKHPIILPKNHHISTLILRQTHNNLQHVGRNQMLACLRQRYWLINAPSAIRKLISKCVTCRRQTAQMGEQKMANLPEDRLIPDEPPFTRVGVDYFGPFEVKQRRSRVKRYGVIFTCLASRAVHLEVAASLDTDSYVNALRRFIARRGQVMKMRSDNGTNFTGAERELARAIQDWNLSQIHESMLQRNVDWQFNPPAGSHFGGVWERLIRTVRRAMNSVVKQQVLDDEGLHTLMCEIESTINSRPITRNSDQPCDLEPLTPNHLLQLKRKPNLPPGVFTKTDNYCKRRWRQVQYLANLFWQRWLVEYLPLLQERQKWHDTRRNLRIGDVVLVVDSNAPRNSWPMGVVLETIPDKLGFVRQAKIKTAMNTLLRPIDKLCLILEMD